MAPTFEAWNHMCLVIDFERANLNRSGSVGWCCVCWCWVCNDVTGDLGLRLIIVIPLKGILDILYCNIYLIK